MNRIVCISLIMNLLLVLNACDSGSDATETNITRLPCSSNSQCPNSSDCVAPDQDGDGIAETSQAVCSDLTAETNSTQNTSLSLFCNSTSDCISGSSCLYFVEPREDGIRGLCHSDKNECTKRCMNGADAVSGECQVDSDCATDEFCLSLNC